MTDPVRDDRLAQRALILPARNVYERYYRVCLAVQSHSKSSSLIAPWHIRSKVGKKQLSLSARLFIDEPLNDQRIAAIVTIRTIRAELVNYIYY